MAWEENSRICLHMQLIAILSRIGVYDSCIMICHVFIYKYNQINNCINHFENTKETKPF